MRIWFNTNVDTTRQFIDLSTDRIKIGRALENDLVLKSPFVADEAAMLYRRNGSWEIQAIGFGEISVGVKKIFAGERCEVRNDQEISIYPFTLTIELQQKSVDSRADRVRYLDHELSTLIQNIHLSLLDYMGRDYAGVDPSVLTDDQVRAVEQRIEQIVQSDSLFSKAQRVMVGHIAGCCLRSELLNCLSTQTGSNQTPTILGNANWAKFFSVVPDREGEMQEIHADLEKLLGLADQETLTKKIERVEREFWNSWHLVCNDIHVQEQQYLALRFLRKEVKDIVFGYGPLEDLIRLPTISEIMVVDRDHIYVEKDGILESSGRRFVSDEVTVSVIDRIVSRIGRRIDKSSPLVDARLSDGSRVNAVIPPLAVSGPCLTIRKFPLSRLAIDDLVKRGAMTNTVSEFLRACVLQSCNILISGGTGTGKTTLLNCISDFIPSRERIVTVEDTAELQINKDHVVSLETKEANIEGAGAYTIRDLVKNALRMRPDRIVVGECRGPEALDMLQAMNTGHDGSMTTIHANNAKDVILRLEVLVQMAADLPVSSIRQQIAAAIDIIVQLQRSRDGRRCISQVSEVVEVDSSTGMIRLKDIFLLGKNSKGIEELRPTGHLPTFMGELVSKNFLNLESFYL